MTRQRVDGFKITNISFIFPRLGLVGIAGVEPEKPTGLWSTLQTLGAFAGSVIYAHPVASLIVAAGIVGVCTLPYWWPPRPPVNPEVPEVPVNPEVPEVPEVPVGGVPPFHESLLKILEKYNIQAKYTNLKEQLDQLFQQEDAIDLLIEHFRQYNAGDSRDLEDFCLDVLLAEYARNKGISIDDLYALCDTNDPLLSQFLEVATLAADILTFLNGVGAFIQ